MRSRHNSTITGSTLSSISWCSATSCSTESRASAVNSFQSVGQLVAVTSGAYRRSRPTHAVPDVRPHSSVLGLGHRQDLFGGQVHRVHIPGVCTRGLYEFIVAAAADDEAAVAFHHLVHLGSFRRCAPGSARGYADKVGCRLAGARRAQDLSHVTGQG